MEPLAVYTSCKLRDAAGAIVPRVSAWWRGSPVNWRIAVYDADGSLSDLAGIGKITLTLTDFVNGGPGKVGWLSREYPASELQPSLTAAQWASHTAWHFQASLSGEDTLLPALPGGTPYWAILEAGTTGGELIPLAALQIVLRPTRGGGLDRDPLGTASQWVEWPLSGPDDPRGHPGSESYDPDNALLWKKVSGTRSPFWVISAAVSEVTWDDGITMTWNDGGPVRLADP